MDRTDLTGHQGRLIQLGTPFGIGALVKIGALIRIYRRFLTKPHPNQGPKEGGGFPGALEPRHFCCGAWSPKNFDTWSPEYLNTVKPGAPNEMLWSPGAPKFLSWSPGALHILGRSPGALKPFGTLPNQKRGAYL